MHGVYATPPEAAFNGALVQAQVLACASLKTLRVREALVLRETPLNVPALTFLTIAIRLKQGHHNSTVLRTIVAAWPHLRHLDFSITFTIVSAPSFPSHPQPQKTYLSGAPHYQGNVHAVHLSARPAAHTCLCIVPS
jgi:hypothetical protein